MKCKYLIPNESKLKTSKTENLCEKRLRYSVGVVKMYDIADDDECSKCKEKCLI